MRRRETPVLEAIETLGVIGDGEDLAFLLDMGAHEEPRVRGAAFRALRALTGTPVPPVLARWRWHWKTLQRDVVATLHPTIEAIGEDPSDPDVPTRLKLLQQYGWADLPLVQETVHSWLIGPNRDLRKAACWLTAELRLADDWKLIERTSRYASGSDLKEEIARTMSVLGILAPDPRAALAVR